MNIHGGIMTITLGYQNKTLFILRTGRRLTIPLCVIFKASLSTSASRPEGYSTVDSLWVVASAERPATYWRSRDWLKIETLTAVSHVGIFIYHFVTPTHFRLTTWLVLLIFTGASCVENLWSMARSRVNMQQKDDFLVFKFLKYAHKLCCQHNETTAATILIEEERNTVKMIMTEEREVLPSIRNQDWKQKQIRNRKDK